MIKVASAARGAVEDPAAVPGAARHSGGGDLAAAGPCEDHMAGLMVGGGLEIARVDQWRGGGHNRQGPS